MRVLCLIDAYLPGYKFGGQLRTLANLVDALGDQIDVWIFTKDRDLGDRRPYAEVAVDCWSARDKCRVFYASPARFSMAGLSQAIDDLRPDIVYISGLFSRMTIRFLVARRLGKWRHIPVILAPRGELSPGALSLKARKKTLFLRLASAIDLFRRVRWQASTDLEAREITHALSSVGRREFNGQVTVAPDITVLREPSARQERKVKGAARFVFVSRVSPKKNLEFALRALADVRGRVSLDVFGPIDDPEYWNSCLKVGRTVCPDVPVRYGGPVRPENVAGVFAAHDFFLFPTLGENFGHVILECLAARTPVLLSDATPWGDLEVRGAGWCVPLVDRARWGQVLTTCVEMEESRHVEMQHAAAAVAAEYASVSTATERNLQLFGHARTMC